MVEGRDSGRKRWAMFVRLAVTLAIAGVSLWWALRDVDVATAKAELARVSLTGVAAVLGVLVVQTFARALRAHVLTTPEVRPPFRTQLSIACMGLLAINVVPLRLGEVVRPALWRRHGVDLSEAGQIVVVERAMDLSALLVMLLAATTLLEIPGPGIVIAGIDVLTAATRTLIVGLLLAAAALTAVLLLGLRVARVLQRLGLGRLATFAELSQSALRRLLAAPGRLVSGAVLTVVIWGSAILVAAVVMHGLQITADYGLSLGGTLQVSLTASAATIAGTLAVPTPGFFGPFELCARASLALWGIETTRAATFGIVWHLFVFGFVILAGMVALVTSGASPRELLARE